MLKDEMVAALVGEAAELVISVLLIQLQASGKDGVTVEDLRATRLELTRVLRSGRTVEELRKRLETIAESAGPS